MTVGQISCSIGNDYHLEVDHTPNGYYNDSFIDAYLRTLCNNVEHVDYMTQFMNVLNQHVHAESVKNVNPNDHDHDYQIWQLINEEDVPEKTGGVNVHVYNVDELSSVDKEPSTSTLTKRTRRAIRHSFEKFTDIREYYRLKRPLQIISDGTKDVVLKINNFENIEAN